MKIKQWLMIAALSAFIAVAIGAFAAHGLKRILAENELRWLATASQYQMYHALALLMVAVMQQKAIFNKWLEYSAYGFAIGILLFSGSLYALALTGLTWLVYVTPLGGLCFLLGWLCLFMAALRIDYSDQAKHRVTPDE